MEAGITYHLPNSFASELMDSAHSKTAAKRGIFTRIAGQWISQKKPLGPKLIKI